jgi:tetratricopeptide (TPR) repeat protein
VPEDAGDGSEFPAAHALLARTYAAKGMYREALAEVEKVSALTPGNPSALASLAYTHSRLNERSQALRALDQLRALSKQRYVPSYFFALVYLGWARTTRPSRGSKRLTRGAPVIFLRSKKTRPGTPCAPTRASRTCCAASAYRSDTSSPSGKTPTPTSPS